MKEIRKTKKKPNDFHTQTQNCRIGNFLFIVISFTCNSKALSGSYKSNLIFSSFNVDSMQLSKATVNRLHLRKSNAHVFADWRRSFEDIWIISYTTKSLCMCVMEIYCHCLGRKTVLSRIQIRFD